MRIAVFDDGNEGKSLPTGFNADVEGNKNILGKVDFDHLKKTLYQLTLISGQFSSVNMPFHTNKNLG